MSDHSFTRGDPAFSIDSLDTSDPTPLQFRDRATPLWASLLSSIFSLAGGVCLYSVAILSIFFFEQVAVQGQEILALLLTGGALVPILGILIFEVGHARALAGFRYIRNRHNAGGKALLGAMTAAVFALLDPVLAAPLLVGAVLAACICFWGEKVLRPEPMWEFLPQEAPSFLTGRDRKALELANAKPQSTPLLDGLQTSLGLFGLASGVAVASWLTARDVLAPSAIFAVGIMTYWSVSAFAAFARRLAQPDPELEGLASSVTLLPPSDPDAIDTDQGLRVERLSVRRADNTPLLHEISFDAAPGMLIGICGDSFSGKSLLMQALIAPHELDGLDVEGRVCLYDTNPWVRSGRRQQISAVYVPTLPLGVPGGGANNISCFGDDTQRNRAYRLLKSLVFTADVADRIMHAKDVKELSSSELKALSFARAFALRPRLYLFDRPEDGCSEKLLSALSNLAQAETKIGSISIFITENRQLLEKCDKLLMLQNGRVIEYADAKEIRARQSTGWTRFVTERDLESEEALDAWLSAHFRRDGDEGNRRAVCMIANEMLSIACMASPNGQLGDSRISFQFKHFAGHCLLKLKDEQLALSSGALTKAQTAARTSVDGERLSPLAKVIRDSLDVDVEKSAAMTILTVKIKTYDPRIQPQRHGHAHEKTTH